MARRLAHLEAIFPNLASSEYSKSSEEDPKYNCFAFAVHDTAQYWQKLSVRGYYWPLQRDDRVQDWIRALELNNFTVTDNWDLEPGVGKVAVYINAEGSPEHVARQLASGQWTSKIGSREDIQHATLDALICADYGIPEIVLKRKMPT